MSRFVLRGLALLLLGGSSFAEEPATPDYAKDVAPILRKYCAGCHNAEDNEGGLALDTFAALIKGGEHGAATRQVVACPGVDAAAAHLRFWQVPPARRRG